MACPPDDPKRENPSELALEGVSDGIEALPQRVDRYGKAKKGAIDVAKYMRDLPDHQAYSRRLLACGDYLVFRHYWSVDKVRLHGARLCCMHLLCPLCAIRRGSKALQAYLQRWEVIKVEKPSLKPFLVTLTVKDGDDLAERFNHLHKSQRELWMRKHRKRGQSPLQGIDGAVWSYEVKRGKNSGSWHPHLHMIVLAENMPDQAALSAEWHNITGDSFIVDVRPITGDPVEGFMEVFKYAVKFSDQPAEDTVHAWHVLGGKRLLASSGCFRGVIIPEALTDDAEGFDDLPYVQLFYRFLGQGFSLTKRTSWTPETVTKKVTKRPRAAAPVEPNYSPNDFQAAYENRIRDSRSRVHKPYFRA